MKRNKLIPIILAVVLTFSIFASQESGQSLADFYKTGKVSFIPEVTLDDNSMPEDMFFESPFNVVCDTQGNVYVCDYRASDIKKFDSNYKFLKIIGRKGKGPGEFDWPYNIAVTKDRLFVWDMNNMRICVLTTDGKFIKARKVSFRTGRPQKMRPLPSGDIVIEMEQIFFEDLDKSQRCTIEIYSPDLEHKKTVYSHDIWRNKLIEGDFGTANVIQPFSPDVYWDVSPDGRIVIGYSEKYEIQIYDSAEGKLESFSHTYKPVKVTAKDKKNHFARMTTVRGGQRMTGAPDYIVKATKFPSLKPAFNDIKVDSDGNILVHTFRKNEKEMYKYFDAFDPNGKFITNVQIVGDISYPASRWVSIFKRSFWLTKPGEDELPRIIKYRISG